MSGGSHRRVDARHEWLRSASLPHRKFAGDTDQFHERDDPLVRQTALDAGAFGFLAKPFEDEALVQLIHKAVAG